MNNCLLNKFIIEEHIKNALKEDIGFGDITTDFLINNSKKLTVYLNSRQEAIICGLEVFKSVFEILGDVEIEFFKKDGDKIKKNDKIAKLEGNAKSILTGERTALNYLQRMSAIATETNKFVEILKNFKTKITDTRKTTPNFRFFEKYSVMVGGGSLHRFNLSDCVMIKDNHIVLAGSITEAVKQIKQKISHTHKIELECDTLEQVQEALNSGIDIILLDNMPCNMLKQAVSMIKNDAITEASGGITISNIKNIASSGVNYVSASSIISKAGLIDLGLDF